MNTFRFLTDLLHAPVAQLIEQWIPNPCAASSILAGGTTDTNRLAGNCFSFYFVI